MSLAEAAKEYADAKRAAHQYALSREAQTPPWEDAPIDAAVREATAGLLAAAEQYAESVDPRPIQSFEGPWSGKGLTVHFAGWSGTEGEWAWIELVFREPGKPDRRRRFAAVEDAP